MSSFQQETTSTFRIEDLPRPHTPELDALIASGKIIKDQLAYRLDLKPAKESDGTATDNASAT